MKRFAVVTEWSNDIAEGIRSRYERCYGIDLKKYIPKEKEDFLDIWNKLMNDSFRTNLSYMEFDELSICEFVRAILTSNEKDDVLFNAVKRYEFYEADVWISAAYNIQYLQADDEFKQLSITDLMDQSKEEELKDLLDENQGRNFFCWKFICYVLLGKGRNVFEALSKNEEDDSLETSPQDVTRWTWQGILEDERDEFYSRLITEKEYKEKMEQLKKDLKGKNVKFREELRRLKGIPKVEDYVLYWKLTGGEVVRRFLPMFHMIDEKKIFDIMWLKTLCRIESVSWQIILIEIHNQTSINNNEINYSFLNKDGMFYSYMDTGRIIRSSGWTEHSQTRNCQKEYENQMKKAKRLLEWESLMFTKIEEINENRKLLVEAMVYLYMSSDTKIREKILELIQNYVKDAFFALQTPSISCFKDTINSHIDEQFGLDGELSINDSLTEEMLKDLMKRVKNRKNGQKKKFKKLPAKIRLQKDEDSLTARYVLLQRIMIRILADSYGFFES